MLKRSRKKTRPAQPKHTSFANRYASKLSDTERANRVVARVISLPKYAKNLFRPFRYKVIYGGRGGARSWTCARVLLIKAATSPTRILCTREIQSSLKDSVHRLLSDQIELMGLSGFQITDREIRHVNGSLFLFVGLKNNVTKIKSLEAIDICWVEEAERVSKESWRVLIPTIRKSGSEIWVTFNPDQERDATWQRFVARKPPNAWVIKVNSEHNPWFPEELRVEKEYDYAIDAEAADHIWGGNLRQVSDAQILRGKWVVESFVVPRDAQTREPLWDGPYQGQDYGFATDPFASIRCWVAKDPIEGDVLYIEHEAWKLHLESDHIAAFVTQAIPKFEKYVTRADSARPDTISYLRRHGLPSLRGVKKGPDSIEDGIAHLRSYRKIVVHSRCEHTQDECKLWSYKVDKNSLDILPIVVDKHNHLMDCLRYALQPLIKRKRTSRFIAADEVQQILCPDCNSLLPDDGECPHCHWHDPALDLPNVTPDNLEPLHPFSVAEEADDGVHELVMHGGTTNGNGNGNGNGHAPLSRVRMRDLND